MSHVTREEYERLLARTEALEGKNVTINVTLGPTAADEHVQRLVRQGVEEAMLRTEQARRRSSFGSYVIWLDNEASQRR